VPGKLVVLIRIGPQTRWTVAGAALSASEAQTVVDGLVASNAGARIVVANVDPVVYDVDRLCRGRRRRDRSMTPFDAVALLAMLLAFYPTVNASELARARRERPEYFAGGTLLGSKGDKLRLPDGRIFDLIQNAGGLPGQQRWQVIEPGPSVPEPWPLEAGPLTPIDVDRLPAAAGRGDVRVARLDASCRARGIRSRARCRAIRPRRRRRPRPRARGRSRAG
jgi:hypothetical protein